MNYPKKVNIIELENAPFRNSEDADAWARSHGVIGLMSNVDTGGKGEVSYEINNIEVLKGTAESVIQPNDKTPMIDTDILLKGVCDVNGVPLLEINGIIQLNHGG